MMALSYQTLFILFSLLTDKVVEAYLTCGKYPATVTKCFGSFAYCCGLYNDECCWETVYSYLWFWFSWALIFILITGCITCICIRRRRRLAQNRYMIVESQPTYGAVMPQGYAPPTSYGQEQFAAAAPPTAPSYMEKPPPYSATN